MLVRPILNQLLYSILANTMRSQTLTSLSLLLLAPLVSTAPQQSAYQQRHAYDVGTNPTPPTWRRLSDAVIRKIWSLPENQKSLGEGLGSTHQAPTEQFVARYGDDVVLRFKIRTADEAKALAEASDVLFLDVWEFNDDWADIRVAKDVVSIHQQSYPPSRH